LSSLKLKAVMASFAHPHANSYANCLARREDVSVCGVYDDDAQRGSAAAEKLGAAYDDNLPELLDRLKPDFAVICSENAAHRRDAEACAAAGVHALCEKPIAHTLADARAMMSAFERAGRILSIAFPVRYSPPVARLREKIMAGEIGRPIAASCTNHGRMPPGWFLDAAQSGGGAVIDHTVHVADVLRWILAADAVEVFAEVGNSLLHSGLGLDDAGLLSVKFEGGFFATIDTSWSRPKSFPTWGDVTINIFGDAGAIELDAFAQNALCCDDRAGMAVWKGWGDNMDALLIDDFVRAVLAGGPAPVPAIDGLKALEIALAAYESARRVAPVSLPL